MRSIFIAGWLALLHGTLEASLQPAINIRLEQPSYANGVLSTELGGVLEHKGLRIQARRIVYHHTLSGGPLSQLYAEGDLAVELNGRLFVGRSLEFDFLTREGTLELGKTQYGAWYLSGARILLHADGSFSVESAKITTCEQERQAISLAASKLLLREGRFHAENVRVKLFEWPLIWFPRLAATLKSLPRFPVHLKFSWRGPQGPMASMRYRLAGWSGGYAGLRIDYILRQGWGGALEVTHQSPDDNTRILSHNYVVTDTRLDCPIKQRRFRVEGLIKNRWLDRHSYTAIQWDKLSDPQMASDYPESYFDLQVPLRTEIFNTHTRENLLATLDARLRVNNFQSINQLLPAAHVVPQPQLLAPRGYLVASPIRLAFQDYQYAKGTLLRDFHSGRFAYTPSLGRSFRIKELILAPTLGFNGVVYSDSPNDQAEFVHQLLFDLDCRAPLARRYAGGLHRLEPYLHWQYSSGTGVPFQDQYLFDLRDGYQQLSILRSGIISHYRPCIGQLQQLRAELYADTFLVNSPYPQRTPKAFCNIEALGANLTANIFAGWDFVHGMVDTCNIRAGWTISDDAAVQLEYRHRSPWCWRKCNFDNYVLDCSVPPDSLVESPLSDRRSSALFSTFCRFTPSLATRIQAYANWDRITEPANYGSRFELFTLLQCNIMLKITAEFTNLENRFSISLALTNRSDSPRPLNPFKVIR